MTTKINQTSIEILSANFSCLIKESLSEEEFADLAKRTDNELDPRICHSHDFLDSNQTMLDAWEATEGLPEIDLQNDAHSDAINRAWDLAKHKRFGASKEVIIYAGNVRLVAQCKPDGEFISAKLVQAQTEMDIVKGDFIDLIADFICEYQ